MTSRLSPYQRARASRRGPPLSRPPAGSRIGPIARTTRAACVQTMGRSRGTPTSRRPARHRENRNRTGARDRPGPSSPSPHPRRPAVSLAPESDRERRVRERAPSSSPPGSLATTTSCLSAASQRRRSYPSVLPSVRSPHSPRSRGTAPEPPRKALDEATSCCRLRHVATARRGWSALTPQHGGTRLGPSPGGGGGNDRTYEGSYLPHPR